MLQRCGWLFLLCGLSASAGAAPVDYEREVKPIFREHCAACHGVLKQQGSLRVDTGHALRTGGGSGPAVVPGQPENSLLLKLVSGQGDFLMPPEGEGARLTADKIATLTRWIAEGAASPADERPAEEPRHYWSYQPAHRPAVPVVAGSLCRNPIDAFLAAEQAKRGLVPRPEADKITLLRRVTLDLTGVPPTRDDLQAFLADTSPDAYERVVARLLASPQYGERWGRHWMDIWRYSDWYGSRGINEIRYSQRHLWRWRDWIIESLNADHGYDRMLREMLAGDELAPGDPAVTRATGFLGRNWYKFDRNVWMFETVEQTAQAFLATTLKCARCHDHKFDPLTQLDYYRFRAFFEPHDVRTDPLTGDLETEKDATLGPVLKTGVSLVYDKQTDVKTFRFQRGDNRYPDESQPLEPGVPAAFGVDSPPAAPVELPVAAWYPALAPPVVAGLEQAAARSVAAARKDFEAHQTELALSRQRLERTIAAESSGIPAELPRFGTVFSERFEIWRPEVWKIASGEWKAEPGKLVQPTPGSFLTIVADVAPPRDFMARIRYRTLETGAIHSVGCFFDVVEGRDAQAIYSATNNTTSSIQAFHREGGVEAYPAAGIVPWPIKLNQELTVDIAARGQTLNVWVNGELAIAYVMPLARRPGKFALWTHAGTAEFYEVLIDPLPTEVRLASSAQEKIRSPFTGSSRVDLETAVARGQVELRFAEKQVEIAVAEQTALSRKLMAEQERSARPPAAAAPATAAGAAPETPASPAALAAGQAERRVTLLKAERDVMMAEDRLATATARSDQPAEVHAKTVAESQAQLAAAQKNLAAARTAAETPSPAYAPLGTEYPRHSTGRRTALARWITDPRHPRTARVAVNHIWLRHFGEALVPSVANFGLNGQRPSHPELLDWLAAEFIDSGWSMKHLHRQIVTSSAYRRVTTDGPAADRNREIDPQNRFLWRMNSRRMEAEVVRDSVLALGGRLHRQFGGPEIAETQGEQVPRRSLYFRSTPNEKMPFLDVFDQANPNECYRRQESVMPQQALALTNSLLSSSQADTLAAVLLSDLQRAGLTASAAQVIPAAFEHVLSRPPKPQEQAAAEKMLSRYVPALHDPLPPAAIRSLIHVLLNHSDFVTIR